jgi:transposase InsO family protein
MILYTETGMMLYISRIGHASSMSWKESSVQELRRQFVALYHTGQYTKTRLCALFGISRPTGDLWLARYDPADPEWVLDRSHARHHTPHATPPPIVEAILGVRKAHPTWGPKKIRGHLCDTHPAIPWPAASTMGRLLDAAGLIPPSARQAHPAAWPSPTLTEPSAPNVVWAADLKGWFRLGNRQRCDPLTVTDGATRFLLACDAYIQPTSAELRTTFERLFREYGLPTTIRTDNGSPFATTAVGGVSRVSLWWIKLGIRPERIQPGCPQQNGRHERFHRTLLGDTRPAADLAAQQAVFDAYRTEYNTVRPHEALDQVPPARRYVPSPRPYPTSVPAVEYPLRMAVRSVRQDGTVKWQGSLVFLSEALAGEHVGWDQLDERLWIVYFAEIPLTVWDAATGKWLPRKRVNAVLREVHPVTPPGACAAPDPAAGVLPAPD